MGKALIPADFAGYDFYVLVQAGWGMAQRPGVEGPWSAAERIVSSIAQFAHEADGSAVYVITFSSAFTEFDNVGPEDAASIFTRVTPRSDSWLAGPLQHALDLYAARERPAIIVTILSDAPEDGEDVIEIATPDGGEPDSDLSLMVMHVGQGSGAMAFMAIMAAAAQDCAPRFGRSAFFLAGIAESKTFGEMLGEMNFT